jgi:hypothetical protein
MLNLLSALTACVLKELTLCVILIISFFETFVVAEIVKRHFSPFTEMKMIIYKTTFYPSRLQILLSSEQVRQCTGSV